MCQRVFFPFLAFVAVLAAALQCQTSGAKPNAPANRRLEEFIKVVNSGDYDSIRAYAQASFSKEFIAGALDDRVDALMRLHDSSREFEIFRIMSSSKDRVIAEVSNRLAEMNQALGVSVERSSPHRITMWYTGPVSASRRPEGALPPAESQIIESMNGFLDRLATAGCFSGSVLVAKGDSILLLRAVGLAHRDPDKENRTNTRFNIASVGKLFTAVAVAQLAEKGLLSYRDPIGRHLGREWVSPDAASEILIEHLLTHRSGLGDFLESETMRRATAPPCSLDDYKSVIRAEQPQFKPGSQSQYSNSGFILLGAVVERISGQTFADYISEHVFTPAGIVAPYYVRGDSVALRSPDFAVGYTSSYSASGRSWTDNVERMAMVAPSPAGGQYLSVEDLWRFANALRTNALVRDSTWQSLASPAPLENGPPTGYGFEIRKVGQERIVGHGGSHEGIGAVLDMYLRSGYILVVLSNSDRSALAVREKFASFFLQ